MGFESRVLVELTSAIFITTLKLHQYVYARRSASVVDHVPRASYPRSSPRKRWSAYSQTRWPNLRRNRTILLYQLSNLQPPIPNTSTYSSPMYGQVLLAGYLLSLCLILSLLRWVHPLWTTLYPRFNPGTTSLPLGEVRRSSGKENHSYGTGRKVV